MVIIGEFAIIPLINKIPSICLLKSKPIVYNDAEPPRNKRRGDYVQCKLKKENEGKINK